MLLIPLILLVHPVVILFKMFDNPLYAPNGYRWCCPFKEWVESCFDGCCGKVWIIYVVYVVIVPCILVLGLIIGCFNIAIFAIPAYLF